MRRALITGITGQDGSYLAELLLGKGYEVWGIIRRSSSFNTVRIEHLYRDPHVEENRLHLVYGDLSDGGMLARLLRKVEPDEIYNLAAQSHVRVSFDIPEYTSDITAIGVLRLLEAIRETKIPTRFYQASSSELFGNARESPQSESTAFAPKSPYAAAKLFAHRMTGIYREAYDIFACCGILFNHESPRRGATFVTRKVTRAAARIKLGLDHVLHMGNLDAQRDWGFAGDYVKAMWLMLQQERAADYVIATGVAHSVRDLLEVAFSRVDLDWREHVKTDAQYFRPLEVHALRGDASRARAELQWSPTISFRDLITMMVDADLAQEGGG